MQTSQFSRKYFWKMQNMRINFHFTFRFLIFFQNVFDQITKRIEKLRIIFDRKFFFEFLIFFFTSLIFESISTFVFQATNIKNKNDKFFNINIINVVVEFFRKHEY